METRFSPKLQKRINEKYTASADLGILMLLFAVSASTVSFMKTAVEYALSKTDLTSLLISTLVVIIMLGLLFLRTLTVNKQFKQQLNQIKRNTFDYNTIKRYESDIQIINVIKIILEYKVERALFGLSADWSCVYENTTLVLLIAVDNLDETSKKNIVKAINSEFGSEIATIVSSRRNNLVVDLNLKQLSPQLLKVEDLS